MIDETIADRLQACYSGAVYDVLRAKGYKNQTLPNSIQPLNKEHILAGRIFTIQGEKNEMLNDNETLLRWCELLSKIPADVVVICQPNDNTVAHMGELSAETLTLKKVRGYIVDGGCRDSAFIQELGFPVFCKYYTPVDIVGKWVASAFEEEIIIGDVSIKSGDYIIADRDGSVIIPQDMVEEVVAATEKVLATENLVRTAILKGIDPVDAFLMYGKF